MVARHDKKDSNSCYLYCNECGEIYGKLDNKDYETIYDSDRGVHDGWYSGGANSSYNLCPDCAKARGIK